RSEIDDAAVAFFRRWLDNPASGELRLPPNPDLYRMTAGRSSRCLHAAVWQGETILVSIGVAAHSRCGASLWRMMHDSPYPLATSAEDRPPEPWIAARIEAGLALYPEAANWLGDMERCLAWAWIEYVVNRRK